MAPTPGIPSMVPPSSSVARTAPATVPTAPIRKIARKRPASRCIFRRFVWISSSGMASGTAYPQTTSSNTGASAGITCRFTRAIAMTSVMIAPLILAAQRYFCSSQIARKEDVNRMASSAQ